MFTECVMNWDNIVNVLWSTHLTSPVLHWRVRGIVRGVIPVMRHLGVSRLISRAANSSPPPAPSSNLSTPRNPRRKILPKKIAENALDDPPIQRVPDSNEPLHHQLLYHHPSSSLLFTSPTETRDQLPLETPQCDKYIHKIPSLQRPTSVRK